MAYEYAYNPINSQLDIVGKSSPASGGGAKFVGVTGLLAVGSGNWVRIAQIQFTCSNISSEDQKKNICFDGQFVLTKQNANPYSYTYGQKSCKVDVHIQIPYITDTTNLSNHYTRMFMGMTDCVNFASTEIEIVETAHVVSGTTAYVYCDLYAQLSQTYDRYFYSFISNADADEYNRIKVVPAIAEAAEYIPYGTGLKVYGTPFRPDYTLTVTAQTTVSVTHNLNTYPDVVIIDSNGNKCLADVNFTSLNTLTVSFSESFTGTIYCK